VRTTVESGFGDPKMMIELDCIAYAPKSGASKKSSAKKSAPKKTKRR
jgi:hypothetical protein